jgi:hypothetical protein
MTLVLDLIPLKMTDQLKLLALGVVIQEKEIRVKNV